MAYYKEYNSRNNNNPDKPPFHWWFIVFLMIMGAWPIALVFLIVNLSTMGTLRKPNIKFPTPWRSSTYRSSSQSNAADFSAAEPTPSTDVPDSDPRCKERAASLKRSKLFSTGLMLGAIIFAVMGAPHLMDFLRDWGLGFLDHFTIKYSLLPAIYNFVASGVMGFFGTRLKRNLQLEHLMATITGSADNISIQKLSSASGYNKQKVIDLVKDAINHGLFGPDAYIDMRTKTLVIRGEAPEPAPKKKKAPAKPAPEPTPENTYQAILRQLREVNDAIPGEEMSDKIDQLEAISARIFTLAEKAPDKKPQLNKFMDYYLPTALKLLNTYATLDQQGTPGANVTETMASIENAMDMLIQAFSSQLDKLFQSDALDVSSDIAALQSMLTMDGLTPEGPFEVPQSPSEQ